jgi:hypothetical protein
MTKAVFNNDRKQRNRPVKKNNDHQQVSHSKIRCEDVKRMNEKTINYALCHDFNRGKTIVPWK